MLFVGGRDWGVLKHRVPSPFPTLAQEYPRNFMQPWKTIAKKTLLNHSPWLTVEEHTIELPNGRVIDRWPWVITKDYVNVVAVTTEGKFLCFRQTKYAVDGVTLAPVGGYLDPSEDALAAAQRELLEETGYEAEDWIRLGSYRVDGNHGAGTAHLFLARGASQVNHPSSDDLEEQHLLLLSRHEVEAATRAGEFRVLGWAAAMALALTHLND
jgi:ADP-ribose pyrophosphatase